MAARGEIETSSGEITTMSHATIPSGIGYNGYRSQCCIGTVLANLLFKKTKTLQGDVMADIMIVDDSAFTRKMMRTILETLGHQVTEAENGPDAINQYSKQRSDIVTLDMLMPDMEGPEVLDHLKAIDPSVRVIVCTSNIQSTVREDMLKKGAVAFLNKPTTEDTLREAIEMACRRHQHATKT
jgi:two-component system, chemotaxis family, chemotaxis protein CheY